MCAYSLGTCRAKRPITICAWSRGGPAPRPLQLKKPKLLTPTHRRQSVALRNLSQGTSSSDAYVCYDSRPCYSVKTKLRALVISKT